MGTYKYNLNNTFLDYKRTQGGAEFGGKAHHVKVNGVNCHLLFFGLGVPGAGTPRTNNAPANGEAGAASSALYLRLDGTGGAYLYVNVGTESSASWSAMTIP